MDGYAFSYSDKHAPLKIVGEMVAGAAAPLSIRMNEATRIFTGAPLPEGADTVVMQEKAEVADGLLRISDDLVKQGMHVRAIGAEIRKGETAMHKDTRLSPAALAFLAGIGIAKVPVYAPISTSIILTGNELETPGHPLTFGKVYDANSVALCIALKQAGVSHIDTFTARDEMEVVEKVIATALVQSDLVLLTGGVSVGDYDFVAKAAEACGVNTRFHRIKQKPGKPLYFGTSEDKLVFGLPGNPSSALTCFYMYVLPALSKLLHLPLSCRSGKATLTNAFQKPKGLTQFVKASVRGSEVTILHAQESFRLHSFATANCIAELDEERDFYSPGEEVTVHLLPS